MLVIRLQRVGKKHQASFKIVLQDRRWKPSGKALELLGFYNPISKEKKFQQERIKYWISKGAQPSPTLHNMLVDAKIIEGEKVKAWKPKKQKEGAKTSAEKAGNKQEEKIESKEVSNDETAKEEKIEKIEEPTEAKSEEVSQ